ncbi:MAG: hypothetical protein Ct9H300mP16_05630 [Pseudomonadota bacterium]|nr:MAG: hypothetical protein Ct9H300mP16_05630 [Pseudomonadota bacterium]
MQKRSREAYDGIMTNVQRAEPEAGIDGVLIEPMAGDGVEMISG